jgi:glucose/mannose-6-phosphate isomerase
MNNLDNINQIKKLDSQNMIGSIDLLPAQIKQASAEVNKIDIPDDYKKVDNVVINGMGGSGLGAHIIQSVFFKKLRVPIANIHSYDLPGVVDKNTLYIISSYSGNTEEPVGSYEAARKRGAKILGIASEGKLANLIKQGKIPGYVFSPKYNPCNQPRIGIGYSVFGLLGLLKKCNVIKLSDSDVNHVISYLEDLKHNFERKNLTGDNLAKQTADHLSGSIPVIVAAEFLSGNAHAMANQINENAKNFSTYHIISELNHHLLEGLRFPASNTRNIHFVFFESELYHERNIERIKITKEILRKNKIDYISYKLRGTSELTQSFEALMFGSYVSFYLSMINGIDPSPIPWVDYFKNQLS